MLSITQILLLLLVVRQNYVIVSAAAVEASNNKTTVDDATLSTAKPTKTSSSSTLVLSKQIMELTRVSAKLSKLAYVDGPTNDTILVDAVQQNPPYSFDSFSFYNEEPDQVIIAKRDEYCYVAFRGKIPECFKLFFRFGCCVGKLIFISCLSRFLFVLVISLTRYYIDMG